MLSLGGERRDGGEGREREKREGERSLEEGRGENGK